MIGEQPTGHVPDVIISAVVHEGLTVTVNGRPGRLAVIDETGHVVAAGDAVAREARAVAVNCYRQMWIGQGHLRVLSAPVGGADAIAELVAAELSGAD